MSENRPKTDKQQATKRKAPRSAWKPGWSGNPGGRPKQSVHLKELAREQTPKAIKTLIDVMEHSERDAARVRAAEILLDRAWGRAPQAMELSGPDGGPIEWKKASEEFNSLMDRLIARGGETDAPSKPH